MDYENKPPFMDEPPIFTVHEGMPKETQRVRTMAPTFLLSLVEEGIFENLDGIEDLPSSTLTAMEGGTMSAAYLLRNNDAPVIVKFGTQPTAIAAEARTLRGWLKAGIKTPRIHHVGKVSTAPDTGVIIQEAISGENGQIAQDGYSFAKTPADLSQLGVIMGKTLARMHTASTGFGFGTVRSYEEGKSMYPSMAEYLQHAITRNASFINTIAPEINITHLTRSIQAINFPKEGVFVHNDYGRHNILITNTDPLEICVIDPNPLSADPYWDLGHQMNRVARYDEEAKADLTNSAKQQKIQDEQLYLEKLLEGYKNESGIATFDSKRLAANRFTQLVRSLEHTADKIEGISDSAILEKELAKLNTKKELARALYQEIIGEEALEFSSIQDK